MSVRSLWVEFLLEKFIKIEKEMKFLFETWQIRVYGRLGFRMRREALANDVNKARRLIN